MSQTISLENFQSLSSGDFESKRLEESSSTTESFQNIVSSCCENDQLNGKLLSEEVCRAAGVVFTEPFQLSDTNESASKVNQLGFKANIISPARFEELQQKASRAMVEGKIYRFVGPKSVVIRVLRQRGWIQVFERHYNLKNIQSYLSYPDAMQLLPDIQPKEDMAAYANRCEETILSLMVANEPVKLVWLNLRWHQSPMLAALSNTNIIFNKIGDPYFAPKNNLAKSVHQSNLMQESRAYKVKLPRTYLINEEKEMRMFIEDYRNTACLGFLKYVVERSRRRGMANLFDAKIWHIPFTTFEFAYNRCTEFLQSLKCTSISKSGIVIWDWDALIQYHMLLTSNQGKIQSPRDEDVVSLIEKSRCLLAKIKECWRYYSMEGYRNVWILKPRYSLAGRGITVTDNLDIIGKAATEDYLVQKYVERPLLIHNAKGDIRQYFLVTKTVPLQVWMYIDSYIRLSTQAYTLNDFHKSIHVTNATVQNQYKVSPKRDSRLPTYNMLSSQIFQKYLEKNHKPNEWETKIYPQMKQAIIGSLLANQEYLIQGPNNFELFGADFILDEDCTPWLLEINQNPLLALSNPVTSSLSPVLAEDIFKVVLDHKNNNNASTGRFELIFNQSLSEIPSNRKYLSVENKYISKDDTRRQMYKHLIEVSRRRPGK